MGAVVALDALLESRRIWRGQPAPRAPSAQPTGFDLLDDVLPDGGWPETALTELLLPADGVGELRLLWPTLARLSRADGMIALIAPPYLPFAQAWANAGVRLNRLQVIRTDPRNALWAAEQCLRSAACSAVLCWPHQANDRALRRLQVAAETGQCLGFAMRPMKAAANPSPAALRIAIDAAPAQLRVLKCRGGNPPTRAIPFPSSPMPPAQPPVITALPARSPATTGQWVDGGDSAQKPAMDGRRPASGQEALMKGRSTVPTGRPLRDQVTPASTAHLMRDQAAPALIPSVHPLVPATFPFRPRLLPTQAGTEGNRGGD